MVSKESKERAIKLVIISSLIFTFASYSISLIDILSSLVFIVSFTLFTVSGVFLISAMLTVLYDRRSFIELVKNDFRHVYGKLDKKKRKK